MTEQNDALPPPVWRRPFPARTGPDRSFGGYYRSPDRKVQGRDVRGAPLQTAEVFINTAYRVVDAQIKRGVDVARRLRGIDDRAQPGDPGAALDLPEQVFSRGLLFGLELLEGFANQPGSPLKRLLGAEFRILGSMLGLTVVDDKVATSEKGATTEKRAAPTVKDAAPPRPAGSGRAETGRADLGRADTGQRTRPLRVRHQADTARRAVTVVKWDLSLLKAQTLREWPLTFHCESEHSADIIAATLSFEADDPILSVATNRTSPPGLWRAAVCTADGEQVGVIDISL